MTPPDNTLRRAVQLVIGILIALALTAMLSGCAEFRAGQAAIADHGAQAADAALRTSKWGTCQGATIGALERELGGDRQRILGWLLYCDKRPGASPLLPPAPPATAPQSWHPRPNTTPREVSL